MRNRPIPSPPAVMLSVLGLFMLTAAFGTWVPGLVHDRVPHQFVPVMHWVLGHVAAEPGEGLVKALAHICQAIIGLVELTGGVVLLAAAFSPARRRPLADFGCGLFLALFGVFMLTMFAMHDKDLPRWNQYPAILAWIGVTWAMTRIPLGPAQDPSPGRPGNDLPR
jgi:hypothetical protein